MQIETGTEIYYTGDIANESGWFVATVRGDGWFALAPLSPDDKRTMVIHACQIGHEYRGHCNPRFVTRSAVEAHRRSRGY